MPETPTPVVEVESRAVEAAVPSNESAQVAPWAKEVTSELDKGEQETRPVPAMEMAVVAKGDTPAGVRKLSGNTADSGAWDTIVKELSEHLTS